MAEAEKQQKLVKPYTMIASGMAAMVAAMPEARSGGDFDRDGLDRDDAQPRLCGPEHPAREKASTKVNTLPTNVRDRLSTQKVRIPGKESPEPSTRSTNGGGQPRRLLSLLQSIPDYLKNLPSARTRSILLAGVLA